MACMQARKSPCSKNDGGAEPHHWPLDDTYLAPAVLLAKSGVMMTPASAPAQAQTLIAWLAWVGDLDLQCCNGALAWAAQRHHIFGRQV